MIEMLRDLDGKGWLHISHTLALGPIAAACGLMLWALVERRGRRRWCGVPSGAFVAFADTPYRRGTVPVSRTRAPDRIRWSSLLATLSATSSLSAVHFGLGYFLFFSG